MTDAIQDFRDLRVWQGAMTLVTEIYSLLAGFPGHEIYGLSAQLRRSAVSIPSNVAEGYRRESTREYLQHLSIAQGSLAEVETQIELAVRLHYLDAVSGKRTLDRCSSVGKQLFALRNSLLPKLESRAIRPDSRLPTPDS